MAKQFGKLTHCYHPTCAGCSIVPFPFGRVLFAPSLSPVAQFSNATVDDEWLRKIREREAAPSLWPRPSVNRNQTPLCERRVTVFPARRYRAGWRNVDGIRLEKQSTTNADPWIADRLAVTVKNRSGYSVMNNDVSPVLPNPDSKAKVKYIPNPAYRPNPLLLTGRAKRQPSPLLASSIEDSVIREIMDAREEYEQVYQQEKARIESWAKRKNRQFVHATIEDVIECAVAKKLAKMRDNSAESPFKYATQEDIDRARAEAVTPLTRTRFDYKPFVDGIDGQADAAADDKDEKPIVTDGEESELLFGVDRNDRTARQVRRDSYFDSKAFESEQAKLEQKQETAETANDRRAKLEEDIDFAEAEYNEVCSKYGSDRAKMDSHGKKEYDAADRALRTSQTRLQRHDSEAKAQMKADSTARFQNSRIWRDWLLAEFEKAYAPSPDGSAQCCSAPSCGVEIAGVDKLARERAGKHFVSRSGVGVKNKRRHMNSERSGSADNVFGSGAANWDENVGMSLEAVLSLEKPWGYTEGVWKRSPLPCICRCGESGKPHPAHEFTWSPSDEQSEQVKRKQEVDNRRRPNESEQEHTTRVTGNAMECKRQAFFNEPLDNAILYDTFSTSGRTEHEGDGGDADAPVSIGSAMDWAHITNEETRAQHLEQRDECEQRVKGKRKRKRGTPLLAMDPREALYWRIMSQGVIAWREQYERDKALKLESAFLRDNPAVVEVVDIPKGKVPSAWGPMPSDNGKWMRRVAVAAEVQSRYPSGSNSAERSAEEWEALAKEFGSALKGESFRRSVLKTMMELFSHPDISRSALPDMATEPNVAKVNEWAERIDAAWSELYAERDPDMEAYYCDEDGVWM